MKQNQQLLPLGAYLHRGVEREHLQTRIPVDIKHKAMDAAQQLDTSLNRLVEAALSWYVDSLKKEKLIK